MGPLIRKPCCFIHLQFFVFVGIMITLMMLGYKTGSEFIRLIIIFLSFLNKIKLPVVKFCYIGGYKFFEIATSHPPFRSFISFLS